MENIPAGYEPVSLIEALNGPPPARARPPPAAPAIASPDTDTASQVHYPSVDDDKLNSKSLKISSLG